MNLKMLIKARVKRWVISSCNHIVSLTFRVRGRDNRFQYIAQCRLRRVRVNIRGDNNVIMFKKDAHLFRCGIFITGNNNVIEIGESALLCDTAFHIEDSGNRICIGAHTTVYGKTQLAAIEGTSIEIGEDCMFSTDIEVRTGDSHSITEPSGRRINPSESVTIGRHVWVGSRAMLLKGAQVGKCSIIGAGSVVTGKFTQTHAVLAGVPARMVKENINWSRERL